ncbi:MAG: Nramp family divalent metal transporter [Bacteroidetes bacterium]|nr:Nramp family divalent metal transporter [Bacteroidota bacterium]
MPVNKEERAKHEQQRASLPEVHASVDTASRKGFWKKLLSFMGPAYLVSVGYMDPGNWATDIAGGSQFGYSLIWVLLMSNIMALLLQSLSARLGLVRRLDLAQASRENFPPVVNFSLYLLAEIAIAACDLAEVLGMAIGLQLLFHIPLLWGVCISVLDTFLLIFLMNYGIRRMEAFIISLVAIIGVSFFVEMLFAGPDMGELVKGFVPYFQGPEALYIAIGIIGATVMPHNLYLHSSLVQTRKFDRAEPEIRKAIKFNILDSTIALNLAFFVNSAILVLAASAFYTNGLFEVHEIQDAYHFLEPMLGTVWAPILFAVALIAAGQSSTVTGTLAGQIIMEGYLNLRLQPWIRRLITRMLAIIPAFLAIWYMGEAGTGQLLVLSQVILSLQLGFAVIPLIHFVSDREKMGVFTITLPVRIAAWLCATVIVGLNMRLVWQQLVEWIKTSENPLWIELTVIPVVLAAALLLIYITFVPFIRRRKRKAYEPHGTELVLPGGHHGFKRIAVAVDFSATDGNTVQAALLQGHSQTTFALIHVLETPGAFVMGHEIHDLESESDRNRLKAYASQLQESGHKVETYLGFGSPKKEIPRLSKEFGADLLVLGAHGHSGLKDLLLGTTVDAVRHRVKIPVFIVK